MSMDDWKKTLNNIYSNKKVYRHFNTEQWTGTSKKVTSLGVTVFVLPTATFLLVPIQSLILYVNNTIILFQVGT